MGLELDFGEVAEFSCYALALCFHLTNIAMRCTGRIHVVQISIEMSKVCAVVQCTVNPIKIHCDAVR